MSTVLATFSVLKDHVKLKVSQDSVAIDNLGNANCGHYIVQSKFCRLSRSEYSNISENARGTAVIPPSLLARVSGQDTLIYEK